VQSAGELVGRSYFLG